MNSIVPYLFFGMVILGVYGILSEVIALTKRTWRYFVINGAMSVVLVPIMLLLLPRIGLKGSAIAEIASFSVGAMICLFWCRRNLGLNLEMTRLIKILCSSLLALLATFWIPRDGIGLIVGLLVFSITYFSSIVIIGGLPPRVVKSFLIATVRSTKI